MKLLAVCCLLLSALCLRAELAFKWTVEVSQPLPYAAEALQGESFNLEAKVVQYRVPMLEAAEATFYYQTPEMEASQWYTVPAAWDATTATASVAFTPAMDVGSTKYRFFFGIETAQGKNYRVFGTLRLKASPGFSPATLTPTDVRAEIIQEILEAVFEESDERYATREQLTSLEEGLTAEAIERESADQQLHQALALETTQRTAQLNALTNTLATKAEKSHTHPISQVTNLQAQLNAKAATSTVSALTTRLTTAEAAIEEVADAKQDKLTRETSSNNVGSLDPQDRNSMASAGNMGDVSFMLGTLKDWGFTGETVAPKKITLFRRGGGTTNGDTDMWLRILRWDGSAWYVAYQATTYVTHSSYTENGQRIEHTMEYKGGTVYIPTDERLLVCYATSADADAKAFINFGAKAIASTTMNILTGQSQMAASPSSSGGFRQALAIEAEYTVAQDLGAELEGKADVAHTHDCSDVEGLQTVLDAKQDKLTIDYALSTTSTNPVQNKAVKAELDKKLALTGGTVTGETLFRGGIRTDSFKTLYGTPLLETVSSKGFKFTGLYQFVPYQQTKPFFTADSGTTTLDVTTVKATSFVEDGTALSAKYATKSELAAVPTVSQDMSGMSIGSSNGKSSFYFLSDGGVTFSTTSKGDTRSATLVGQAALAGKADAQHTHAFEEMAVTVSGASYRWQWDETEGTFALVAE